ncbi:MAG: hypothetical protein PWP23_1549 [Candidatus Sumerlaeota bacterium]|nr:hypothetical protein [Candidatus Sumerlaeota bacterium]
MAIGLLSALPYFFNSARGFFYTDDWVYLARPGSIPPWQFWNFFVPRVVFFWRPLADWLFSIEYHLFGLNATPFVLVSILLHLLVLGAFGWFGLLLTSRPRAVLLACALAGTNWVAVDTVSWISNQSALLAALFSWLCLGCWLRVGSGFEAWGRFHWAALVFFVAAHLCRQSSVCLLPALVVLSVLARRREPATDWWLLVRRLLPFLAAAVIYVAVDRLMVIREDSRIQLQYEFASPLLWPRNMILAFLHISTSPLGGNNQLAHWMGTGIESNILFLAGVGVVGVASFLSHRLRGSGSYRSLALTAVLYFPMFLFVYHHGSRYYYLAAMAMALFGGLLADRAFEHLAKWKWKAPLLFALVAILALNWGRLWLLTAADVRNTEWNRDIYELLAAHQQELPEATLFILPARDQRPSFGMNELVRFGSGRSTSQAMFADVNFDAEFLAHLHATVEHVYFVRTGPEPDSLILVPGDKDHVLPPL